MQLCSATSSNNNLNDPKWPGFTLAKVRNCAVRILRTFSILEACLSLLCGAFIGALASGNHTPWMQWITALLVLIYIPLLINKLKVQWEMPASLFDNLDASLQLREVTHALKRKASIDAFVDQSIKALNAETCTLSSNIHDVCDQPVYDGLKNMILPIINHPQQILDCEMAHFTVGVIVDYAGLENTKLSEPIDPDHIWLSEKTFFALFRDNLSIDVKIPRNVFAMDYPKGIALDLLHSIQKSKNENAIDVRSVLQGNDKMIQLISSPIPMVCEENNPIGVIWIFRECVQPIPEDLENILRIFGRIAANWLSKFDECHRNRLLAENQDLINGKDKQ